MPLLLELIRRSGARTAAFIGMAKNAGKTTALNTVVSEAAAAGVSLAAASYGRDGEDTDVITLKEKPRIYIPPETIFVTTEHLFAKSGLDAGIVARTPFETVLGRVLIYRSGAAGGEVELAGINRGARMAVIRDLLKGKAELFLIDGALDRRSSAMPSLSHGMILSTGAAAGADEETVARRTIAEIERLTLPGLADAGKVAAAGPIIRRGQSAAIEGDTVAAAPAAGTFGRSTGLDAYHPVPGGIIVLGGALTDSYADYLLMEKQARDLSIVVRDGTRVFLGQRRLNLLKQRGIQISVLEPIRLLAVTVNPFNPYGPPLDSPMLMDLMNEGLAAGGESFPVVDVESASYIS